MSVTIVSLVDERILSQDELDRVNESKIQIVYDEDSYIEIDDPIFAPDSEEFDVFYGDIESGHPIIEIRNEKLIYFVFMPVFRKRFAIKIGKCINTQKHLNNRLQEAKRWNPDCKLLATLVGTDKTEVVIHEILKKYVTKKGEVFYPEGENEGLMLLAIINQLAEKKSADVWCVLDDKNNKFYFRECAFSKVNKSRK
jgi:hypothetical protein